MDWAMTTARDKKHLSIGIWYALYQRFDGTENFKQTLKSFIKSHNINYALKLVKPSYGLWQFRNSTESLEIGWKWSDLIANCGISIKAHTCRDNFVYAPSQSETTLQCNVISHWLSAYIKWSLQMKFLKTWSNNVFLRSDLNLLRLQMKMNP